MPVTNVDYTAALTDSLNNNTKMKRPYFTASNIKFVFCHQKFGIKYVLAVHKNKMVGGSDFVKIFTPDIDDLMASDWFTQ